jgi:hypothetical protein
MCDVAKSSWPELLGKQAEAAEQRIKKDRPDLKVFLVPAGFMVTADVNTMRVRIFLDDHNKVVKVPVIG